MKIRSPFEFPELNAIAPTRTPDVEIVVRAAGLQPVAGKTEREWLSFTKQACELHIENVASYFIEQGRRVVIELAPRSDMDEVRAVFCGTGLVMLLYQRNYLLIHASVAEIQGKAVAFAGLSGSGKSSMAAACHALGHRVVSDDIAAIQFDEGSAVVKAGYPRMKLNPEMAAHLGIDPQKLKVLNSLEPTKRGLSIREGFVERDAVLGAIYLLSSDDGPELHRLAPRFALIGLVPHATPSRFWKTGEPEDLSLLARLVKTVPVYQFNRKPDMAALLQQIRRLEDHLRERTGA